MREILTFCESEQPWLLDLIAALVRAESPTDDKTAVDACGRVVQEQLETCGARVTRLPQAGCGDQLLAHWGDGDRQLLLLGHIDTVWRVGQLSAMPCAERDGRLYGPGVFDMKAGVALGIQAVRALRSAGRMPASRVSMLLTTDEETGSRMSRGLVEAEARRSAAVLVLEPSLPGGALKTSRKGCGEYELLVRGKAAHAGVDPSKGASAIRELALKVIGLEALQDLDRGVTLNVGLISGGMRANVVPDAARAIVDVRVPTLADAQVVDAAMRALAPELPGTSLQVRGGIDRPPLERSDSVVRLYQIARQIAAELGHGLAEGSTGGGSDGNFTAALGTPTLDGLGAVGDGAHASHEHVTVADLPWRAALIAGLLARLS
jgi:glutamate carboxypeptidase